MTDSVRVERDGAVGRIVFDRPDANNAMDATAVEGLRAAAADLASDDALRSEAEALAAGPTRAYAETRELLWTSLDHGLGEQLAREADRIAGLTRTADYQAGYAAFFGEESPDFTGE